MKSIAFILLNLSIFVFSLKAQLPCGTIDISASSSTQSINNINQCVPENICNSTVNQFYQPIQDSDIDLKTIPVVLHIMQRFSGDPQNFEDIMAHRNFLIDIINFANDIPLKPGCPVYNSGGSCTGASFLADTKIRFELDTNDIYFEVDELAWEGIGTGNSISCLSGTTYAFDTYGIDIDCKLNIFFIDNDDFSGCGPGYFGESTNFIFMSKILNEYNRTDITLWERKRNAANVLVHELGHGLGLGHTYFWSSCNQCSMFDDIDCPDDAGFWCDPLSATNCSNNIMGRGINDSRRYLSPLQIGQMTRLLTGTWRSKMLDMSYDASRSLSITNNQLWEYGKVIKGDITVKSGNTLTIKCLVIMPINGKIIVEKGAKLVVDGGVITTKHASCNGKDYWTGIEVLGNPSLTQSAANQGVLELKNNAIIEYANNAIVTGPNGDATKGGGIIKADNTTFRNNRRSVELLPYALADNQSYFTNCTFELTADYPQSTYVGMVTAWNVWGIPFTNCTFSNTSAVANKGNAIYTIDAGYSVLSGCTFSGFTGGVYGTNSSTTRTFSVSGTTFSNNALGVYAGSVNNISSTGNTFNVGQYRTSSYNHGVYLKNSTGYTVEGNDFTGYSPTLTPAPVGVICNNTGDANNVVRENNYTNLYIGNYAYGDNLNSIITSNGLRFLCNINTANNKYDFRVGNDYTMTASASGIATPQGSSAQAAGNVFSLLSSPVGSDYYNATVNSVQYYYQNVSGENPLNLFSVTKTLTTNGSGCTSFLTGGGGGLSASELANLQVTT